MRNAVEMTQVTHLTEWLKSQRITRVRVIFTNSLNVLLTNAAILRTINQSNCIFSRCKYMSSFNKKILTVRPTRQPTLKRNKQKVNIRIMIVIKKSKRKNTHALTHTKKNTRRKTDRVQKRHKHANCKEQCHNIQPIADKSRKLHGSNQFEWSKYVYSTGKQWKLCLKHALFIEFY